MNERELVQPGRQIKWVKPGRGAPTLDTSRLLSGHPADLLPPSWSPSDLQQRNVTAATNAGLTAWAGPWGVSFAINLTPDTETGIAEWSEEGFIRVARTGKHQGQPNGRDILPPMPWFNMKDLSDRNSSSHMPPPGLARKVTYSERPSPADAADRVYYDGLFKKGLLKPRVLRYQTVRRRVDIFDSAKMACMSD